MYKKIGKLIYQQRIKMMLTYKELSLLTDTSISYLCQIEKGNVNVTLDKLVLIFYVLKLKFDIVEIND